MKKTVNAIINWIPYENGGRKKKISVFCGRYNPIIVFEGEDISYQAWSADVYVLEHISDVISKIQLSYLFPEAPFSYLESGNKFRLYEGAKMIANGEIL